jgi:Na+-translocating ferredoxin:NAD+ oxidoreductase subunit B
MILIIGILIIILIVCLFAIILILAYDFFNTDDGKIHDNNILMPGINCGICGYAGCDGYLNAVIADNEKSDLCSKDDKLIDKLDSFKKKNPNKNLKFVAKIFCLGDDSAKTEYIFNGKDSCQTVYSFYKGDKVCKDACLGRGDCMDICPEGAVKKDKKNRIWIDSDLCTGCKICMKICPTKVIKLVPENGGYFIACSSHKGEKFVKEECNRGCINCGKCDSIVNDSGRLAIENGLAVVRYNSKRNIVDASNQCPTDVIVPIRNQKAFMENAKSNKSEKYPAN